VRLSRCTTRWVDGVEIWLKAPLPFSEQRRSGVSRDNPPVGNLRLSSESSSSPISFPLTRMSTRSKTKALAAAAAAAEPEPSPPSNGVRSSSRIRRVPASKELEPDANQDTLKRKPRPKPSTSKTAKASVSPPASSSKSRKKAYCLCKGPDDGTPMVQCSECKDW
jgi:hypothetical protein